MHHFPGMLKLIILLVFTSMLGCSQRSSKIGSGAYSISGRVMTRTNHLGIPLLRVICKKGDGTFTADTDYDGNYAFSGADNGSYLITARVYQKATLWNMSGFSKRTTVVSGRNMERQDIVDLTPHGIGGFK